MAIRNRHKRGDYLVVDDESGFTHYRSECEIIWNGEMRVRRNFETRNPQEFVEALNDPRSLNEVRPEAPLPAYFNVQDPLVGNTNLASINGVASHLYGRNGIGEMTIEDSVQPFVVA